MTQFRSLASFLLASCLLAAGLTAPVRASDCLSSGDWPQFRGRRAAGVADGQDLPVSWDAGAGTNILWKTAIPGLAHASPIVCGDSVYILTATSDNPDPELKVGLYGAIKPVPDETSHVWRLYRLNKYTGAIQWTRKIHEGAPKIKRHTKATHANSTPATDGARLAVMLGSEGLYCYDLCGNLLWKKDLGVLDSGYYLVPSAQWGFGSSPIIYQGMVIIQCDVQKNSFLAAFDVRTGHQVWRTPRDDAPTWSTPTIYEGAARTELIVNGFRHAGGYDPLTGRPLWKLAGGGDIPVPTPVAADDLIFLSSSHGFRRPLCAVRAGASGDITPAADATESDQIAWLKPREAIYMQTPIVYRGYLYACRDNGLLSCYEARTGKSVYRQRLGRGGAGFTASAVASDGKLYFTSEEGTVYVVQAGPEYKLLAANPMNDVCMATPAISDGLLIVRTKGSIYAIGTPKSRDTQGAAHPPGRQVFCKRRPSRGRRLLGPIRNLFRLRRR